MIVYFINLIFKGHVHVDFAPLVGVAAGYARAEFIRGRYEENGDVLQRYCKPIRRINP